MGNMLDYLDWRGDLTLAQSPFNEVDNVILSQLAYLNLEYVVPPSQSEQSVTIREAAERYFALYRDDQIRQYSYLVRITTPLLRKLAQSDRFAQATLSHFENRVDLDRTSQFAAVHVGLPDGSVYISYRGTDNNMIGWKENFHMGVMTPVPAQFEALRYLEETAGTGEAPLRIGGHSKGGNLAVYAAAMCRDDIKRRIVEIYNNDGPGFDGQWTKSASYLQIRGKIRTIVPRFSIVGMLLEHEEPFAVVKSNKSLFMQHDAFSWEVLGNRFVREPEVAEESRVVDAAMKSWLGQLDRQQRMQFVSALFQIFEAANIWTVEDFTRAKWKKGTEMIRALNQSQANKVVLTKALKLLLQEGKKAYKAAKQSLEEGKLEGGSGNGRAGT
jgi:hypothetical protein